MEELKAMARRLQGDRLSKGPVEYTGKVMLMDSGASVNVIGQNLVNRHGLKVHSQQSTLFGADGYEYKVLGATRSREISLWARRLSEKTESGSS